ncbi:MAG: MATE family efflux transporter [Candidatus Gastranaerophilales bacterium]|nr:MATE family efflux transporter [Candidatus Gastranaerophilales bacterium]
MTGEKGNFQTNDTFVRTTVQKYMIPSVAALIGTTATTIANSMIVGNYIGTDGLAALNLINPVYFAFATLGALINVGASTSSSVCIGKKDQKKADSYVTLAFWLTLALSAAVTAIGLLLFPQLIKALGATARTEPYLWEYGRILLWGGTALSFMYYPFNFLKTDGRPKQGTYMFLVMFVLDLAFCLLFVGKHNMGMKGVALSLILSTLAGDLYGLYILYDRHSDFSFGKIVCVRECIANTLRTGSSMALNNLCNIFKTAALNYIILRALSEEGLTVFAVIGTVNSFSNAVISGIAQTVTPLIGVFYGEGDHTSIRTVIRESLRKGAKGVLAMTAFICLFAKWIGTAFGVTDNPLLFPAILLFSISFLPAMFNCVYIFYYFTTAKNGLANILTFGKGFLVPTASAVAFCLCGLPRLIWLSFAVAEFASLLAIFGIAKIACQKNTHLQGLLLLDSRYEEEYRYLAFSVENTAVEASAAAEKISRFCREKNMSSKTAMTISLAVEEMLLIIFEHCLCGLGTQYADVRIVRIDQKIILYMRCAGKLFDPISYYEERKAEAEKNKEVLVDDSLGIEMIVKQAADVTFSRTFGMNNLTILIYE